MRVVDPNKLQIVEQYAESTEDLTDYVKELGYKLYNNTMSCPFHGSDSTPSLKVTGTKWKCFGCGRGGGYLKFREELEKLEYSKVLYYDVAQKYVTEVPELQKMIGGTIFKSQREDLEDKWNKTLEVANSKSYRPQRVAIESTDALIRKAKDLDTDAKLRLLAGIQEGLPYPILKSIVNGTELTGKSLLDLAFGAE